MARDSEFVGTAPHLVIAGLDPAIHEAAQQFQTYVRLSRATAHHGCAGHPRVKPEDRRPRMTRTGGSSPLHLN
jgi:hypothetical protein